MNVNVAQIKQLNLAQHRIKVAGEHAAILDDGALGGVGTIVGQPDFEPLRDGQGGRLGQKLVETIRSEFSDIELMVVGTNSLATERMLKAGAKTAATGENALIVACRTADIIVGPIGIAMADSLMGEITPKMATAIGQSKAIRILIPTNQCDNRIAGVDNYSLSYLMRNCIDQIRQIITNQE